MQFPDYHYDFIQDTILITGIFRSGTTMLGNIIGSLQDVEYCFEPPLLLHLDFLVKTNGIEPVLAAELLRTFLIEDILINYQLGRYCNMRPSDNSCIFNIKSYTEIIDRWHSLKNTEDAVTAIKKYGIGLALKYPATYSIIPVLLKNYPNLRIVEIKRNLKSILLSIYDKKWFSDETQKNVNNIPNWPYYGDSSRVPYYIDNSEIDIWKNSNEITKIAHVLITLTKQSIEMNNYMIENYPDQYIETRYEDILLNPEKEIERLSIFLNRDETYITKLKLLEIKPTKQKNSIEKLLSQCDEKMKTDFFYYNKLIGYS